MKRTLIFITAAICALSSSCTKREVSEPGDTQDIRYAEYSFQVTGPQGDSAATRSVMEADPDQIRDICAFAFDASSGEILRYRSKKEGIQAGDPVMAYVSGQSSFEWSLPLGVEMDIYAVCNMGRLDAPSDLSEFLSSPDLVYKINDISDLNSSGVPMTAVLEGLKDDSGGNTYVLPARRIVTKYSIRFTGMPDDYEITGIRICNVNSSTTLFAENEAADASSALIMGDWATDDDLEALNSGGSAEFFMFENAQSDANGISLSSDSKWFEVHGRLGDAADYCTYLDILSTCEGNSRRDRLYLGEDCRTNFDVVRNTVRNITCPAPVSVIFDAGQDILIFTGDMEVTVGETVDIPFIYNLSLSEAGTSSISFTADEGLTPGSPSFNPEGENCGTGSVPVTCSLSAPIGGRLAVRMESGEASAQTEVSIANKVVSVMISAPQSTMYTMAMQLSAEALFADGSTVTDPAAFEWRVTEGATLSTVENGFLVRNGYVFGPVRIRAEYDGMSSNELSIDMSETLFYINTEPNPIYVYENSTVSARFRAYTATITDEGSLEDVKTTTAYLSTVTYSIADPSVASASDNDFFQFDITGIRRGETSLDIAYTFQRRYPSQPNYGTAYAEVPVIVGDYQYGLVIEAPKTNMYVGEKMQLKAYFVIYYKGAEERRINVTDVVPWESSNSYASVTEDGIVTALKTSTTGTGSVSMLTNYNGYSASLSIKIYNAVTKELHIEPNPLYMEIGDTQYLTATLYNITNGSYDSGTDVTSSVVWTSDNPDIASVSSSGYAKALSNGSTYINGTYTLSGTEYFAYIDVYVGEETEYTSELEINPSSATIDIGSSIDLTATHISYSDGSPYYYEDVTDWNVCFWSSSNTSVATVSAGRVKGISEGTVTITAKYGSDPATATIRVKPSTLQDIPDPVITHGLEVTVEETGFTGGGTTTATATLITYKDGVMTSSDDVTSSASWSSGDTSVATVNAGHITVKNVTGTAVIMAMYNGKSDSVTITATKKEDPAPEPVITHDLVVSAEETGFTGGGTTTATATFITYKDGVMTSSDDVTPSASWSSGDTSVATVNAGHITVKNVTGTAVIKAMYNGKSDSVTITATKKEEPVPEPVITHDLVVSPSGLTVYDDGSGSFTATFFTYTDGVETSHKDVTSSCSWSVISGTAYISVSDGIVTGKGGTSNGSAAVQASYTYEGSTYTDTGSVTYEHVDVTTYRLDVSAAETSFTGGGSTTATATYVTMKDGVEVSRHDVTSSATWSSSNPSVAEARDGSITVNNVDGSAIITAVYNGQSGSVTVSNEYVDKGALELAWTSLRQELLVGNSTSNTALYYEDRADSPVNVSSSAIWSSSNPSVATVSNGVITATGEGRATITATYKGYTASCIVSCVESLYVVNVNVYTVSVGTNVCRIAVDLALSDGSVVEDADYSWKCTATGNPSIVTEGTTGTRPLVYKTSGTTWNFIFSLTVYAPEGVNPESVTTGTSVSASEIT